MSDSIPLGKHYTYALAYPEDYPDIQKADTIFYIGKGTKGRLYAHEREARRGVKSHRHNVIRKIWTHGKQVVKIILAYFDTHEEACMHEIALIFFLPNLTNKTLGGDGVIDPTGEIARKVGQKLKGRKLSEETRRKIGGRKLSEETRRKIANASKERWLDQDYRHKLSEKLKGRIRSEETRRKLSTANKGRQLSQETRRKLSEALKGHPGHPISEENRRKLSERQRGKKASAETIQRLRESHKGQRPSEETLRKLRGKPSWIKGKTHSAEARQKIRIARARQVITEETRRKIGEAHRGRVFSVERRRNISKALKGRKHSEETRKRLSESHKGKRRGPYSEEHKRHISAAKMGHTVSEETRRKISEANKNRSPEYRQKLSDANKGRTPWNKGKPMSDTAKAKLSETLKGKRGHRMSEEAKRQLSERSKGNTNFLGRMHTEEARQKIGTANAKVYPGFIAPDGKRYESIVNMNAFCREHDLIPTLMGRVSRGERPHHKGWRRAEPTQQEAKPVQPSLWDEEAS